MSLETARTNLRIFSDKFNHETELRRERESAVLRHEIDLEVWELHNGGISISGICKQYGTKDWNTIKKIIDRKPVEVVEFVETRVTVVPEDNEDGYTNVRRITVERYNDWTVSDPVPYSGWLLVRDPHSMVLSTSEQGSPLHLEYAQALRDESRLWKLLLDTGLVDG